MFPAIAKDYHGFVFLSKMTPVLLKGTGEGSEPEYGIFESNKDKLEKFKNAGYKVIPFENGNIISPDPFTGDKFEAPLFDLSGNFMSMAKYHVPSQEAFQELLEFDDQIDFERRSSKRFEKFEKLFSDTTLDGGKSALIPAEKLGSDFSFIGYSFAKVNLLAPVSKKKEAHKDFVLYVKNEAVMSHEVKNFLGIRVPLWANILTGARRVLCENLSKRTGKNIYRLIVNNN